MSKTSSRTILALASACALIAGLTISPSNTAQLNRQATATQVLAQIPAKGRALKTGYSRAQFGQAWTDTNHNGCDTRKDILKRDLTSVVFRAGTHDCVVLTGILHDPLGY